MQLFEIKNDIAKILYTPSKNHLLLADFLLVEDINQSLIAQIVDVESTDNDDANIATVKFSLSINKNANLSTYNGYTPSKNSNIIYIEPNEIAQLIQSTKSNIYWGDLAAHSKTQINLGLSLLREYPCIKCDKTENATIIANNILYGLNINKRRAVVVDFDGKYKKIENANKIRISEEYKLPLNFNAFDFISENDLDDCPIENKAIIQGILLELQSYVDSTEEKFIPFDVFRSVIDEQCNQNPIPELIIFKNKLIKYQQKGLFAQNKDQFDFLNKILSKNTLTIIDATGIDEKWHRFIIETIAAQIDKKCYWIINLTNTNSCKGTLDCLYDNANLRVIPIVSYSYSYMDKLDSICKNLILFAPTEKINDFEVYNSFLQKLNQKEFIIWSENTFYMPLIIKLKALDKDPAAKNVSEQIKNDVDQIFTAQTEPANSVILPTESENEIEDISDSDDIVSLEEPEDSITMVNDFIEVVDDANDIDTVLEDFDNIKVIDELDETSMIIQSSDDIQIMVEDDILEEIDDTFLISEISGEEEAVSEYYDIPIVDNITDDDLDYLDSIDLAEPVLKDNAAAAEPEKEKIIQENIDLDELAELIGDDEFLIEEIPVLEINEEPEIIEPKVDLPEKTMLQNLNESSGSEESKKILGIKPEEPKKNVLPQIKENIAIEPIQKEEEFLDNQVEEIQAISEPEVVEQVKNAAPQVQVIDEDLEEFAESIEEIDTDEKYFEYEEPEIILQQTEPAIIAPLPSQPAQQAPTVQKIQPAQLGMPPMPDSQIVSNTGVQTLEMSQTIEKSIPPHTEHIKIPQKPSVPIYEAKIAEQKTPKIVFNEGNFVFHAKYGKGIVEKIITYGNKTLCSIQFDNVGRRLLDPNLADIKLA